MGMLDAAKKTRVNGGPPPINPKTVMEAVLEIWNDVDKQVQNWYNNHAFENEDASYIVTTWAMLQRIDYGRQDPELCYFDNYKMNEVLNGYIIHCCNDLFNCLISLEYFKEFKVRNTGKVAIKPELKFGDADSIAKDADEFARMLESFGVRENYSVISRDIRSYNILTPMEKGELVIAVMLNELKEKIQKEFGFKCTGVLDE